jgi:hypothetical protein
MRLMRRATRQPVPTCMEPDILPPETHLDEPVFSWMRYLWRFVVGYSIPIRTVPGWVPQPSTGRDGWPLRSSGPTRDAPAVRAKTFWSEPDHDGAPVYLAIDGTTGRDDAGWAEILEEITSSHPSWPRFTGPVRSRQGLGSRRRHVMVFR